MEIPGKPSGWRPQAEMCPRPETWLALREDVSYGL